MISPTGKPIRDYDKWGSGAYGAPRGEKSPHDGVDFICVPGQDVVAPIDGVVVRESKPYVDSPFSGLIIKGKDAEIQMFYLLPDKRLFGQKITKGEVIGKAQNIGIKYAGITPHIHLEIKSVNPELLLES